MESSFFLPEKQLPSSELCGKQLLYPNRSFLLLNCAVNSFFTRKAASFFLSVRKAASLPESQLHSSELCGKQLLYPNRSFFH